MTTITAQISERLLDEIISGELAPGTKLEEPALAQRFNVSRTPVREALRLLHSKGLIEFIPRRGGIVKEISGAELVDMLEALCELESLCSRISAHRMGPMQRRKLELLHQEAQEAVNNKDARTYLELNTQLHQLICVGSQNNTLVAAVERLRERLGPFRAIQSGVERRFELSHKEHQRVVSAILNAQPEEAYQAMRDHTSRLTVGVMERLQEQEQEKERERVSSVKESTSSI